MGGRFDDLCDRCDRIILLLLLYGDPYELSRYCALYEYDLPVPAYNITAIDGYFRPQRPDRHFLLSSVFIISFSSESSADFTIYASDAQTAKSSL